jgi:hypothetical protein
MAMLRRSVLPSALSQLQQLLPPKSAVVVAAEAKIAIAQVPVVHEAKVQIPTWRITTPSKTTKVTLMILGARTRRRPQFVPSSQLGFSVSRLSCQTHQLKVE